MNYTEIIIKIRQIVRSINLESKKVQSDFGVSIPQVLCLEFLKQSPNYQASQKDIRDHLKLNSSTVTGIISRLESKSLLARLPKTGDKRITYITLTSQGDELLKKTPDLLQQRLALKLSKLTVDDLSRINESLDLLTRMLNIQDVNASPLLTAEEEIKHE
ncbi:MarR family winged helix-turn-helix transcriptional regulator [Mangrovibacterium marinum]|uniref:DNA-binding MarR family transcriptional regulator n=1 Tax=Mangrovibacterium marinum TaxID=1639118 RepID=A0A2T5C3A6_9BACT|nr:MarR family transcriptional regulator [Mangrovibacterium marinum]PTN09241.1 DNA-binding MarR family transcriptional regulator [Mangrovibacterium marinum]